MMAYKECVDVLVMNKILMESRTVTLWHQGISPTNSQTLAFRLNQRPSCGLHPCCKYVMDQNQQNSSSFVHLIVIGSLSTALK